MKPDDRGSAHLQPLMLAAEAQGHGDGILQHLQAPILVLQHDGIISRVLRSMRRHGNAGCPVLKVM